jgi:hypothetical protein
MEDHADRQRGLDRDVRIGTLAAWFAAGCLAPGIERFIGKPDREVATFLQASFVLRPIPDPILKLRVLYSLRFGYFIAGGSGVEGFTSL